MELKVLCVGDVVGEPGLERIRKSLRIRKTILNHEKRMKSIHSKKK